MPRKFLLVIVLLLCIAGGSLTAYGIILVTSNIAHVNIGYTVTLSASQSKKIILLTAMVRNNGKHAGAGIDVDFYYSFDGGNWTYFATQPTNNAGIARTRFTLILDGQYDFKAVIRVP